MNEKNNHQPIICLIAPSLAFIVENNCEESIIFELPVINFLGFV